MIPPDGPAPPVCDYEGSDYRARFWSGQGRDYEDLAERHALRRLLPLSGQTLLDVGAGFGRLATEYDGYETVVLLDFSRSLLREAQAAVGGDGRFLFVAANWYSMPFVDGRFDTLVQVRTLHHAADAPRLLGELARITRPGGTYILEFANKRNLKAMLRYTLRRQTWSPHSHEPVEFVPLNFDFHPRWIDRHLRLAGFAPQRRLAVSHFRLAPLKRLVPAPALAALDRLLQPIGRWAAFTPSVFVTSRRSGPAAPPATGFFACPHCRTPLGEPASGRLPCPNPRCGRAWPVVDGLYDFKEPLS